MKIISVESLAIEALKVITFARFTDVRGYFTETYRNTDFLARADHGSLLDVSFVQCNESYSRAGTIRGLHFQWNPYMGKLVRTIQGRMVDLALDIRKGSPTFGYMIAHDMPSNQENGTGQWIWVPPGFAHGNLFTDDTTIEYFCTGEYSQGCEAGISPLATDINWSLCDPSLKKLFDEIANGMTVIITDKDRNGLTLSQWTLEKKSDNFICDQMSLQKIVTRI